MAKTTWENEPKINGGKAETHEGRDTPVYGRGAFRGDLQLSKAILPERPTPPDTVYEIIRNQVLLDARPELNLATFCNEAYTDPFGERVVMDSIKKNFIDHTEYPGTNLSEARSIVMMARELGAEVCEDSPPGKQFLGSATIGSSEAVMLGLIAHKFIWNMKQRVLLDHQRVLGIPVDPRDRPVVLMSAHMHGCWDKFCRYYDAVALYVEIEDAPFALHDGDIMKKILETQIEDPNSIYAERIRDAMGYTTSQGERTIGELVMCVGVAMGTTFTGNFDNAPAIDDAVDAYCVAQNSRFDDSKKQKFSTFYVDYYRHRFAGEYPEGPTTIPDIVDIPIHVDAAASGFVLMFSSNGKRLKFNFNDCPKRLRSMNISNHKYGMTFTGMGSVIFKNDKVVDQSLVYDIAYLGGSFTDYTVNFSRGSSMIQMQYYNFLRFGREGYRSIMDNCVENARWFVEQLEADGLLNQYLVNISNQGIDGANEIFLPTIALTWRSKPEIHWTLQDLSLRLSQSGWSVPAYHIPRETPEDTKGIEVLRIVVQQVVSREKLIMLLEAMREAVTMLAATSRALEGQALGAEGLLAHKAVASGVVASSPLSGRPGEQKSRRRKSYMC